MTSNHSGGGSSKFSVMHAHHATNINQADLLSIYSDGSLP